MRKCAHCGVRHRRGFLFCRIAKEAETDHGARVSWANDPDEYHHLIEFTPETLANYVVAKRDGIFVRTS